MSTVNVFRYTVLATGILYGSYHTSTLKSDAKKADEHKAFKAKEALIAEAKAKYAELCLTKKVKPVTTASTTEINFDDKKLDIAQVILAAVENLKESA